MQELIKLFKNQPSQLGAYALWGLLALAGLGVAYAGYTQISNLLTSAPTNQKPSNVSKMQSKLPNLKQEVKNLTSKQLFGKTSQSNIVNSNSKIKLIGIFFSKNEALVSAVLLDEKDKQDIYFIGDKTPDGAKINKINEDHIIIVRNTQRERIPLIVDLVEVNNKTSLSTLKKSSSKPITKKYDKREYLNKEADYWFKGRDIESIKKELNDKIGCDKNPNKTGCKFINRLKNRL